MGINLDDVYRKLEAIRAEAEILELSAERFDEKEDREAIKLDVLGSRGIVRQYLDEIAEDMWTASDEVIEQQGRK